MEKECKMEKVKIVNKDTSKEKKKNKQDIEEFQEKMKTENREKDRIYKNTKYKHRGRMENINRTEKTEQRKSE